MADEATKIREVLLEELRGPWDGRACIEYLRAHDYNWRQMEWIGWYFEHRAQELLIKRLGGGPGPRYGSVRFDYGWQGVWDFKAHPTNQAAGWAYMNDVGAVRQCVAEHKHLAWVVACGKATYDKAGDFKTWHDTLKGSKSAYELERIRRGASSRCRKVAFELEDVAVLEFRSQEEIDRAVAAGWLRDDMQKNQRNSDGSPREPKYGVHLGLWHAAPRRR